MQGESDFTITKDESAVYHVSGMEDDQVNQNTCGSAFNNAASMEADQLVEADVQDLSAYGLDNPSARVTIVYSDAKLELELGDTSSGSPSRSIAAWRAAAMSMRCAPSSAIFTVVRFSATAVCPSGRSVLISATAAPSSFAAGGEEQVRFKPVENNACLPPAPGR